MLIIRTYQIRNLPFLWDDLIFMRKNRMIMAIFFIMFFIFQLKTDKTHTNGYLNIIMLYQNVSENKIK